MAEQIRRDLHSPDVILIQETEAQDVCTVSEDWTPETGAALGADRLDCDLVNVERTTPGPTGARTARSSSRS